MEANSLSIFSLLSFFIAKPFSNWTCRILLRKFAVKTSELLPSSPIHVPRNLFNFSSLPLLYLGKLELLSIGLGVREHKYEVWGMFYAWYQKHVLQ